MSTSQHPSPTGPRVVVVGPCASGKTTLVDGLRRHGVEARVSGQEHSDVPSLWQRADPDVVIALAVDLATLRRRRRDPHWPEWLYDRQQVRLGPAFAGADLVIDTATHDPASILAEVLRHLGRARNAG